MSVRILAFLVWAAVAATAAYWALRLGNAPAPLPASVQPVATGTLRGDLARLLTAPGAADAAPSDIVPVPPALASRFQLLGVMAPRPGERASSQGIALVGVDGKPPRPYRVGAPVDGELVLLAVAQRSASFGPAGGAPAFQLDLPLRPPPATGRPATILLPPGFPGAVPQPAPGLPADEPEARSVPGADDDTAEPAETPIDRGRRRR